MGPDCGPASSPVTIYQIVPGPVCGGVYAPNNITSGPDGALWFTNWLNNSIGRITTAGAVTNYTGGSPTTENLLLAARSAGLRPPEW